MRQAVISLVLIFYNQSVRPWRQNSSKEDDDILQRIWGLWNTSTSLEQALCSGENWCTEPAFYPEGAILSAATTNSQAMRTLLTIDAFDTRTEDYDYYEYHEDDFENICEVTTEYVKPRAAMNKNGQFRFIVNQPEGGGEQYIQLVRVARCVGAGEECGWGVLAGRETRCQQEYLDHKLVALSESGQELVIDTFSFPSCCTCVVKKQRGFKKK